MSRHDPSLLERWGPRLLSVLVLLGVSSAVVAAHRFASVSPRFFVDPGTVSIVQQPPWLSDELAEAVALEVASGLGSPISLQQSAGLERWRQQLPLLSGWVAAVESVEPRFPAQAELRLVLRRPVIELPGSLLVDGEGRQLGTGTVTSEPLPLRVQGLITMADVRECAVASAELFPFRLQIADHGVSIDRVTLSKSGRVVFLTAEGVELEWGRSQAASEFAAVDLPAATRVAHLLQVAARRPGLFGIQRIILWKDQPEEVRLP